MTYSMLIVDDEPIISRGLANTIPWHEKGIEVVGTAMDGEDAINKINEHKGLDIIITDVKMPNKDGLELATYISQYYPNTEIIMISGYDEFSYAQRAMQLGVKDYLLKPVDIDQLLTIMDKLMQKMKLERNEQEQKQQHVLLNTLIEQVLEYPNPTQVSPILKEQKLKIILTMKWDYYFDINKFTEDELRELKNNWKQTADQMLSKNSRLGVSLFIRSNILLTCFFDTENQSSDQLLTDMQHQLSDHLIFLCPFTVQVKQLHSVVSQMVDAVFQMPIKREKLAFYEKKTKEVKMITYPKEMEQNLTNAILHLEMEEIQSIVQQMVYYFQEQHITLGHVIELARALMQAIMKQCQDVLQMEPSGIKLAFHQDPDILLVDSFIVIGELILMDIERIIDGFHLTQPDHNDWLMDRAIAYIKEYFASDIKAQEVANVINISPNYFSSLFKQKTGKNFNEYVNGLRVEESKRLLMETPFKIHEIAEQVGYNEYKYFVEVFKKFVGMTPTKYRQVTSSRLER
ncbi:response regulator transcription factor [Gracilibacillus dipsosauri]|uniref:DNA-binding response regulator n=1 Tax=Gracilibacillus dipsosauri TaxID=178340 RepID=A0A317L5Z4_9BACI|nr:response regulator [Gracilibacillus dipsosauri]PWU70318.1 hypothetical protein DLJ74_00300 [Gracilibacillus dipsosauri]